MLKALSFKDKLMNHPSSEFKSFACGSCCEESEGKCLDCEFADGAVDEGPVSTTQEELSNPTARRQSRYKMGERSEQTLS